MYCDSTGKQLEKSKVKKHHRVVRPLFTKKENSATQNSRYEIPIQYDSRSANQLMIGGAGKPIFRCHLKEQ